MKPQCEYAKAGRGDCENFIGLPGLDQDVDHDGPRTEDVYGKPNGWCWSCWRSYQLSQANKENIELRDALKEEAKLLRKKAKENFELRGLLRETHHLLYEEMPHELLMRIEQALSETEGKPLGNNKVGFMPEGVEDEIMDETEGG